MPKWLQPWAAALRQLGSAVLPLLEGPSSAPASQVAGPRGTEGGLAKGFTHDTLGPALPPTRHRGAE